MGRVEGSVWAGAPSAGVPSFPSDPFRIVRRPMSGIDRYQHDAASPAEATEEAATPLG
jgi:hypothetical protein